MGHTNVITNKDPLLTRTAGINRSNGSSSSSQTTVLTGGRTALSVKARANSSDRFVRPVPAGPVRPVPGTDRQACPTCRQVLRSDSACPTTGTRLFEHRSNCRV
ncbi:hypothetical protein PCASD_16844 [Puccinia coronata f. sp. avenae]|uniref:Uncharacterized protein n=1 Tax=Puccinia coronata f. sp. avenae TaxID=200324 RepID=A0A2N5U4L3_9BASI|nr:hypothetical protein PCASD_16844 [Puccinia coronata f. sp. avenae]